MAFTLEDLLSLPDDVQPEHAARAGLTVPPPAPVATGPQPPTPMAPAAPAPAATTPQPPAAIIPIDGNRFFSGAERHPRAAVQPMPAAPDIQHDFSPNAGLGSIEATDQATTLPKLNFKQRQALPTTSPGVEPGSSAFFENKIGRIEDQKANPWGTPENHGNWLGKAAHVAAKIGNVAGDVVDPAAMSLIPETDLGRRTQESNLFNKEQQAKGSELAAQAEGVKERQEDTREQHEEDYRAHQLATEALGNEKLNAVLKGLDIKSHKNDKDYQTKLRSALLKVNPDDPDGPPIPIPDEELSPKEKQQHALLQSLTHARDAKAAYDEYKANPNSPQAQAALIRARASTTAANAAAERAGIANKAYLAEFLGTDENDQPLAGVELTDDGRPIGTKISSAPGNKVTNTTRSMAEMARTVQPQIEVVKGKIHSLADSLGPAAGRWNELMVNKGGTDYPEFAGLDQDLDLLSSAIVRTHFGARGGQQYREALRKNFGEAQSPEDLLARIDSASGWIQGYANADQAGAGGPKRHVGDKTPPKKAEGTAPGSYDPKNPPTNALRQSKKDQHWEKFDGKTWQKTQAPAGQP